MFIWTTKDVVGALIVFGVAFWLGWVWFSETVKGWRKKRK